MTCFPLKRDKTRVFLCACTCISAYDETPRKELEAVPTCKSAVYIMCSDFWRVRPGRAVSLCRGRGHRLMGQIMVRLIRTGSTFVGRLQRRKGIKKGIRYLLGSHCLLASPGSACSSVSETEREAKRRQMKEKEENKRQRKELASCTHIVTQVFFLLPPSKITFSQSFSQVAVKVQKL